MSERWIRRVWERRGVLGKCCWLLFLPLSCVYWFGVQMRNALYTAGWKKSQTLEPFIISIGNLTVGGTGKTPAVVWIAQELQKLGFKIAVLSRGYQRSSRQPLLLTTNVAADVDELGDEPAMMARLFGLTVAVSNPRYEGALEAIRNSPVDVFIMDDGFQHRQLDRDVDIVLLGADCAGWVLPSGPFREPKRAAQRADLLLVTGARDKWQKIISKYKKQRLVFSADLQPVALVGFESRRWKEYPLTLLAGRKIVAVTGIGNPEPFYRIIHDWEGEIVNVLEFADHYRYSSRDWQQINRAARNADLIVTTEKDILKLIRFPFGREKLYALRVTMAVENGDFLIQTIVDRIQNKCRNN
ncbi:MAG TPA: tetraacyldisaccharide 4'-kinase [Candidatus Binatia bacterium]